MKNKKTFIFIYFIGAIGAYLTAALNFVGEYNTSLGLILPRINSWEYQNLLLRPAPVFLSRDGKEGVYEIIWPEKISFKTEENETVFCREDDMLISSRWFENPDYHEETIIRRYHTGEILERFSGQFMELPDNQKWIVG